jgi:hypothetical protein
MWSMINCHDFLQLKRKQPPPSTIKSSPTLQHHSTFDHRIRRVPHTCYSFLVGRPHALLPVPSPPAFAIRQATIAPFRPFALPPARFRLPLSTFSNTSSCTIASHSSVHTSVSASISPGTCTPHVWDAEVTVCLHIAHFADAPPQRDAAANSRACFASVVLPVAISSEKEKEEEGREEPAAVAVADRDGSVDVVLRGVCVCNFAFRFVLQVPLQLNAAFDDNGQDGPGESGDFTVNLSCGRVHAFQAQLEVLLTLRVALCPTPLIPVCAAVSLK